MNEHFSVERVGFVGSLMTTRSEGLALWAGRWFSIVYWGQVNVWREPGGALWAQYDAGQRFH